MLDKLFVMFAEFRSLFDYRLKAAPHLRHYMVDTLRRATEFHINCPLIGPRFRIQHGQNTYVFAREVGSDFWINHTPLMRHEQSSSFAWSDGDCGGGGPRRFPARYSVGQLWATGQMSE
jgi:hypothetical protein